MSDARDLTMSAKELDRLEIISRVVERRLTQQVAADQLGLGLRQVERLCRAFRTDGPAGLVSHKRGVPSNRILLRPFVSGLSSACEFTTRISARRWRVRSSRSGTTSASRTRRCADG